jgi:hypothetical protein
LLSIRPLNSSTWMIPKLARLRFTSNEIIGRAREPWRLV